MAAGQEEATQRVVKKLKEDQTFSFKKKRNEKQYIFNDNVKDQLLSTGKHLDGIEATISAGEFFWADFQLRNFTC